MKLLLPLIVIFMIFIFSGSFTTQKNHVVSEIPPSPTPYQFPYKPPAITKNNSYRIVIVGDSIVASLGVNANSLREDLIRLYPDSEFVTYNYGYPATNILTLPTRLSVKTTNQGSELPAVLEQGFELIIIESFGYNPLSEYPLPEGLAKQNEILDLSVRQIIAKKPDVYIAFLTPLAFDTENFARGTYDLSTEQRKAWIDERIAYIQNHKRFAEEHGIPLIDVYGLSKEDNESVKKGLIGTDYIHPSAMGVKFISHTIAEFIYSRQIFPK